MQRANSSSCQPGIQQIIPETKYQEVTIKACYLECESVSLQDRTQQSAIFQKKPSD